jgi:hypothetical protein
MKLLAFLILTSIGLQSLAQDKKIGPEQFTGKYVGTGVYRLKDQQTFCKYVQMSFEGNNLLMNFGGGERICDNHSEKFAPVAMAYKEGKLYFNGRVVGEINGNVLVANYSAPEGNGNVRHWRMSMRKEGNNLMYEESRIMNDETTPLISFAGIMALEN